MNRRALAGLVALAAALTMLLCPAQGARAGSAPADCVSSQLLQAPGVGQHLAGSVPVVFIHGITSSSAMWETSSGTSIAGQAALIKGVTVWTFDYAYHSLDWVDNQSIGPAFASAISCLARASGHKVIVVAHSMGGLATQYAIGYPGSPAVGDVAELITIGTPYRGSALLTAMQAAISGAEVTSSDPYEIVFAEALLSACAGVATHSDSNPCGLVSVPRSPVGTALQAGSAQIRQLPPWPAGLPVLDTAGNIRIGVGIGALTSWHNIGDGPVLLSSATAHDTAGPPVIEQCVDPSIADLVYRPGGCFHTHLPNDPKIIAAILGAIRADVSSSSMASYVGQWYVHGAELRINADGSGEMTWNAGPCSPNINVNEGMCTGNASITFKPLVGGIVGTFTNVWYTAYPGPLPADFNPPTEPAARESFTLKFTSHEVLYTTYSNPAMNYGNRNWCRAGYYNPQICGA
jgi:pimeloyl-ACP methyl ester carboxylesterase